MKSLLVKKPLLYISNFTGLVGRKPLEVPSWCLHVVQSVCLREPGCIYVQFNLSVNDQRSDTKAATGAFTEVDRDENIKNQTQQSKPVKGPENVWPKVKNIVKYKSSIFLKSQNGFEDLFWHFFPAANEALD